MNIREWANNHPSLVMLVTVVVVVIALFVIFQSMRDSAPGPREFYYFDLDAGESFIASLQDLPPAETPAGGANGVRAGIYACGECPANLEGMTLNEIEQAGAFVAYFERYTDEAKAVIEQDRAQRADESVDVELEQRAYEAEMTGRMVRAPEGDNWISRASERGMWLTEESLAARCGDDALPVYCLP